MCGIVGVAGDVIPKVRDRVFRDMLDVCQVRGRHSTGVIKVDGKSEYTWIKQVGPPSLLCDTRGYEETIERGLVSVLVGHCRYKTVGEINVKTAHPFDYPKQGICGVHNGTLQDYRKLDTYDFSKVDSEVLYGHLAENGPQDTFDKVKGAYACVWWDDKAKELCFFRNSQRPLWFTWSKDLKRMYWASEQWMFGAVDRLDELWDGGEGKSRYVELPPQTLWRFKVKCNPIKDEKHITLRPPIIINPVVEERPTYAHAYQRNGGDFRNNGDGTWTRIEGTIGGVGQTDAGGNKPTAPVVPPKTGGEAPNPFLDLADSEEPDKPGEGQPKAQLPGLTDSTTESGTSIVPHGLDFLRRSLKIGDSKADSSSGKKSEKKTLSLPGKSSNVYPLKSNGKPSKSCESSNSNTTRRLREKVSFRTVAGLLFITDNKTSSEYNEAQFEENTGKECLFCKTKVQDFGDVGEFLSATTFLCTDCLAEPEQAVC